MESTIKLPAECTIAQVTELVSTMKEDVAKALAETKSLKLTIDLKSIASFDGAALQFLILLKQAEKSPDFQLSFTNVPEKLRTQLQRFGASYIFANIDS